MRNYGYERSLAVIFPVSKFDISIDNDDALAQIKASRSQLKHKSDKSLLSETDVSFDFCDYNEAPEGRYKVKHGEVVFDCLFKRGEGKKLFVFLSGAKTTMGVEFKRWSYYNLVDGSMLNIADPMYGVNKELMVGWYYGTQSDDFRARLVEIVKRTAEFLKIKDEDIIFISSSGGGAAILQCAALIEKSTAVSINPQIDLDLYFYAKTFKAKMRVDFEKDEFNRSHGAYWIKKAVNTKYILVINIDSEEDMNQLKKLKSDNGIEKDFRYGLNKYENLIVWLYSADDENHVPHTAQEDKVLFMAIKNLVDNFDADVEADVWKTNYLIYSELWSHIWSLKNQITLSSRTAFCLNSANKITLVYAADGISLKSSQNNYNATVIMKDFKPKSVYRVYISNSSMKGRLTERFAIGFKDNVKEKLLFEKEIKVGCRYEFDFLTGPDVKNMELKLYAGIPGATAGNELTVDTLSVSLLEELEIES